MPANLPLGVAYIEFLARTSRLEEGLKRTERRLSRLTQATLAQTRANRRNRESTELLTSSLRKLVSRGGPLLAWYLTMRRISREVSRVIGVNDRLVKTADAIGLSVEGLQELRFAADRSGVGIDTLDRSLAAFAKRLGEARVNTGVLYYRLDRLNPVLLRQITHMNSVEDAINAVWQEALRMGNEFDRANLLAAAFGRIAGPAMLRLARDSEEMRQRARDLGLVIEEDLLRKSELLQDRLTNLRFIVSKAIDRAVLNNWEEFDKLLGAIERGLVTVIPLFTRLISGAVGTVDVGVRIAGAVTNVDPDDETENALLAGAKRFAGRVKEVFEAELENLRTGPDRIKLQPGGFVDTDPGALDRVSQAWSDFFNTFLPINVYGVAELNKRLDQSLEDVGSAAEDAGEKIDEKLNEGIRRNLGLIKEADFRHRKFTETIERQRAAEVRATRFGLDLTRLGSEQAAVARAVEKDRINLDRERNRLLERRNRLRFDFDKAAAEVDDPNRTPFDFVRSSEQLEILNRQIRRLTAYITDESRVQAVEREAAAWHQVQEELNYVNEFYRLHEQRIEAVFADVTGRGIGEQVFRDVNRLVADREREARLVSLTTREQERQVFLVQTFDRIAQQRLKLEEELAEAIAAQRREPESQAAVIELERAERALAGFNERAKDLETTDVTDALERFKIASDIIDRWHRQREALEDAARAAQQFERAFVSAMESAIFQSRSFEDAIASLLRQLAQLALRQAILEPIAQNLTQSDLFRSIQSALSGRAAEAVGGAGPDLSDALPSAAGKAVADAAAVAEAAGKAVADAAAVAEAAGKAVADARRN